MSARSFLLAVVALCLVCAGAMAAQNLNSASGYVQLPDASVAETGTVDLSAAYVRSEGTNELSALGGSFPCDGDGWNARALWGVWDRFELGAGYLGVNKEFGDANAWTIAGKYQVYKNDAGDVAVAVGANYRDWSSDISQPIPMDFVEVDLPKQFSAYLAVDKAWPVEEADDWCVTTTIGVMYDHFDSSQQRLASGTPFFAVPPGFPISDTGRVDSDSFIKPFFGVKLAKDGWTIMGEYKPRMRTGNFYYQKDLWSAAVRKEFAGRLAATAGVTNFNLPYTNSDPGVFFDLSYRFGK